MSDAPHTPAAFINAIAEEGSKKEAVEWLQKTWNERCHLERENEALHERLKAIDAVQVPEEPTIVAQIRRDFPMTWTTARDKTLVEYIDTLRDLLKRESARADRYWENEAKRYAGNADYWRERAEAAEAKLAAMLKLGEEPSEEMSQAGYVVDSTVEGTGYEDIFKAMFAKLVEQSKEQSHG